MTTYNLDFQLVSLLVIGGIISTVLSQTTDLPFTACTRPEDQSTGILCPTTQLCISQFARCDYVDNCGNGEDEAGCVDGEVCSFKRPFVDQIRITCPLHVQDVVGMPVTDGQFRLWQFTENSVPEGGFIREVTFDFSFYGAGLYRLNFSSESNILFFATELESSLTQTKTFLPVSRYIPSQAVTLEKFSQGIFIQTDVGNSLNIRVVSRDCEVSNITECTTAISRAVAVNDCPEDLGEQIYVDAFSSECPTVGDNFSPCIRPDQTSGIQCPTTQLCISEFARCNYVDDCGNGEDEAGCVDGEVCSFKRTFVDRVMATCPLSSQNVTSMPGEPDGQFRSWLFEDETVSDGAYVREVTFDYSWYGTGLYRLNFSSEINILFFSSEEEFGSPIQTKPLQAVFPYIPFQAVTLEKFSSGTFIQTDVGNTLNITVVSRDCDALDITECTSAIKSAVMISDCPSDLGEQIYDAVFSSRCPIGDNFSPCIRPDQTSGIQCPTTQLCISEFARCNYVDDCGNGEDEAGCVDGEVCSFKRYFVDQVMATCPLSSQNVTSMPGEPDGQFRSWLFEDETVSDGAYVREVTFDYSWYGTGLYRLNFSSEINILFFSSEEEFGSPVQTKPLQAVFPYIPFQAVTLEKFSSGTFIQTDVGNMLNITVVSRDCDALDITECTSAISSAVMISDCPSDLGEQIYDAVFSSRCPNDFLPCTLPDSSPGIQCPTTQLCISQFSRCDYVDNCGNGEDEVGCVDNEICSEKRMFVEQVVSSCPLLSRTVTAPPGQGSSQFVTWNVTGASTSQMEYITEVTFNFFSYGTGLYRINFTAFDSVVLFMSEGDETSTVQTKALPFPLFFTSFEMVTLEKYIQTTFRQQNVDDDLSVTVVAGDCEAASRECLIAVQMASRIFDCPSSLGEAVYSNLYDVQVCPLTPDCADNEFACRNDICIPKDYICDGFNDCGDYTDESSECEDCFPTRDFSFDESNPTVNIPCFQDRVVFSGGQSTSKVTFVLTDFEKILVRRLTISDTFFPGNCRANVTTPSRTSVAYQDFSSEGFLFAFRLLLVEQRDTVTITVECTQNPLLFPWQQQNVSFITLWGTPLSSSCEENRACLATISSLVVDYPEHCYEAQYARHILDQYQHCFEPPEITFISRNAYVRAGTTHAVVCVAQGLPTPTIEWIQDGKVLNGSQEDGRSYLSVFVDNDTEVTCRATSGEISVERKTMIAQLSEECERKLDEAIIQPDCLDLDRGDGIVGGSDEVEIPYSGGGLIVNASITAESFAQVLPSSLITFELQIRLQPFCSQPRKRDFGNLVYSRLYRKVINTSEPRIDLSLDPPVLVPESDRCIRLRFVVPSQMGVMENGLRPIIPDLSIAVGVLSPCEVDTGPIIDQPDPARFCDLGEWSRIVHDECFENKYVPQLMSSKVFLAAVERCNGITIDEPTIIKDPLPILAVSEKFSAHTQCQAEHFLEIEWYKKEWYGNETTNVTGHVLSFTDFSGSDQGLYFCVARGGSQYANKTAVSEAVVVVSPEIPTYLATIRFENRNFSQTLTNPQSDDYLQTSSDIRDFFSVDIGDLASDFVVNELRPGSIVADVLVFLRQGASIEEVAARLTPNNSTAAEEFMESLGPNLSSLRLQSVSFCEMTVLDDTLAGRLTFPTVSIGQTAESMELCPVYSPMAGEPRALRACSGDFVSPSQWEAPVINNCFEGETDDSGLNDLMMHLNSNPVTDDNVTEVSRDLADATEMTNLTSNDLVSVAELLEIITGVKSPSPEVTSNVIETVDNVLNLEENDYIDSIAQEEAPSRILQSLENQLTNLHDGGDAVNFTDIRAFVGVVARSINSDDFSSGVSFANFFTNDVRNIQENLNESDTQILKGSVSSLTDSIKAVITLPYSIVSDLQTGPNGTIPLTFVIYSTSHLFMSSETQERENEAVESLIISATIEGQNIDNLVDPVVSKYYPKPIVGAEEESRRCVFWDFSLANGFGDWSEEGCTLVIDSDDESLIECHCNHLTNFAVLVDIQGDIDNLVLDILSIIGCVVSIIALLVTITTFLAVKKLREKRPQQILVNLCFALLGLYLCFVIGIDRSNLPIGCVIFGALIHYFCLASVAWMCVEATNMYLLFVRVFDTGIRGFMWKACLAAWGLPLVVVVVSVAVKSENYTSTYCFPQAETLTFYFGVLLLIALMLCYNLIIFILVIRQLTCGRKTMGQDQDKRKEMYKRAQNAIAISVLLGLTWAFGFLSIGGAQFIFNLLFLIFNSLQGLFVFIFFCLRQQEVRTIWWRWLTCQGIGKDEKYLDSRSKAVSSQANQPVSKDSAISSKSGKKTDSTFANSESIQMIDKEESSTMNSNGDADTNE